MHNGLTSSTVSGNTSEDQLNFTGYDAPSIKSLTSSLSNDWTRVFQELLTSLSADSLDQNHVIEDLHKLWLIESRSVSTRLNDPFLSPLSSAWGWEPRLQVLNAKAIVVGTSDH